MESGTAAFLLPTFLVSPLLHKFVTGFNVKWEDCDCMLFTRFDNHKPNFKLA